MGAYSGVGAYLSKWVLGEGAYSGGGVIREWGLIRSFYGSVHSIKIYKSHIFHTNDKIVIACYSYNMDILYSVPCDNYYIFLKSL